MKDAQMPSVTNGRLQLAPVKARSAKASSRRRPGVEGLTGREYQMLLILNSYGWCTPDMVWRVARFHGIPAKCNWVYVLLAGLKKSGYVTTMRTLNGKKGIVYAVADRGLAHIRACKDNLVCDTNVLKDPASMNHFLALNRIMLQLRSEFKAHFWLTDFQVRADNMQLGNDGLAKDYDSAAELVMPNASIRIGIEYELTQKKGALYAKLCSIFAAEKYLHLIIYFLESPNLLNSIAPHFRPVGGLVCFTNYRDFLLDGTATSAFYWYDEELRTASLREIMAHVAQRKKPEYLPVNQLRIRFQA
jgi:hypothetical protein